MAKVKIELLSSECQRNEFYMDQIDAAAKEVGLDYTLERVMDEDVIDARGAMVGCQLEYCPGCWFAHAPDSGYNPNNEKLCPAIAVNEELRFWDVPPTKEELLKVLAEYK